MNEKAGGRTLRRGAPDAADPDGLDGRAIVDMNEIGHGAATELAARRFDAEAAGRVERGHSEAFRQGKICVAGDEPDGCVHIEIRTRERAISEGKLAVPAKNLAPVQLEDGLIGTDRRHSVGHQEDLAVA
jgi:hypothetical protein